MGQIHPLARTTPRTTPRTRTEIRCSTDATSKLAKRYNISKATVRKWKGRDDALDRSHRAHDLGATLSPAQALIVLEIRRLCLLPLDDLRSITRRFINANASRSGGSRLPARWAWLANRGLCAQKVPYSTVAPIGQCAARIRLVRDAAVQPDPLFAQILHRHTHRGTDENRMPNAEARQALADSVKGFPVKLGWVTAEEARMHQHRKIARHRDGVSINTPVVRGLVRWALQAHLEKA
jgi:hypothetical protein